MYSCLDEYINVGDYYHRRAKKEISDDIMGSRGVAPNARGIRGAAAKVYKELLTLSRTHYQDALRAFGVLYSQHHSLYLQSEQHLTQIARELSNI
jgi:hypothetical protein